jgi:hypothetical protein
MGRPHDMLGLPVSPDGLLGLLVMAKVGSHTFYHLTRAAGWQVREMSLERWPEDLRLVVVLRDPVDRFLSGYRQILELYKGGKLVLKSQWPCDLLDEPSPERRMVSFLEELERWFFDGHVVPQSSYCWGDGAALPLARVYLLDRMEDEWEDLTRFVGAEGCARVVGNVAPSKEKEQVRLCFDRLDLRDRVLALYSTDSQMVRAARSVDLSMRAGEVCGVLNELGPDSSAGRNNYRPGEAS